MTRAVSIPKIRAACLKGVKNSVRKYQKWSKHYECTPPESLIEAEIANSLSKIVPGLTIQEGIGSILKNAGADLRGRKPRNSKSGRIDITVWRADNTSRIAIEIKRIWNKSAALPNDARRLRQILDKRDATLQAGLIVVYTDANKPEKIMSRLKRMADENKLVLKESTGAIKTFYNDVDEKNKEIKGCYWWGAGCFTVQK